MMPLPPNFPTDSAAFVFLNYKESYSGPSTVSVFVNMNVPNAPCPGHLVSNSSTEWSYIKCPGSEYLVKTRVFDLATGQVIDKLIPVNYPFAATVTNAGSFTRSGHGKIDIDYMGVHYNCVAVNGSSAYNNTSDLFDVNRFGWNRSYFGAKVITVTKEEWNDFINSIPPGWSIAAVITSTCEPLGNFPLPPFEGSPPKDDMANCCDQVQADLALLKLQVQEIHQSLQATKFAYDDDDPSQQRVANLGYYIERLARSWGISVNSNGTVRSVRQKAFVKAGDPIPAGWNFGQWGLNTGGSSNGQQGGNSNEQRDGIVYEQRSNIGEIDVFNPTGPIANITGGNYTLCENFPQLFDEILDDLDKGLGWQELGASAVPNADGSGKHFVYEGLAQILNELGYCMSRISQHTSQTQVTAMIVQAVVYEILKANGQPLMAKSFRVDVGGDNYAHVPYPGLANDAPKIIEMFNWVLQTLAPLLGAQTNIEEFAGNQPPDPNTPVPPKPEDYPK